MKRKSVLQRQEERGQDEEAERLMSSKERILGEKGKCFGR